MWLKSKVDFDPAIKDSSLSMRVNLAERRVLVWREDYRSEPTLTRVPDILCIDEHAQFAQRLLTKDPEYPVRWGLHSCAQDLAAAVISFQACFKIPFSFEEQGGI